MTHTLNQKTLDYTNHLSSKNISFSTESEFIFNFICFLNTGFTEQELQLELKKNIDKELSA